MSNGSTEQSLNSVWSVVIDVHIEENKDNPFEGVEEDSTVEIEVDISNKETQDPKRITFWLLSMITLEKVLALVIINQLPTISCLENFFSVTAFTLSSFIFLKKTTDFSARRNMKREWKRERRKNLHRHLHLGVRFRQVRDPRSESEVNQTQCSKRSVSRTTCVSVTSGERSRSTMRPSISWCLKFGFWLGYGF
ncbi:hypothetical protein LR48_Vigan07g049600 [Vigna angularis]|uniref:Uncharacterized protein n=1 Tax=Phaseolus angularis TaxID=3914 RepID=A0A0L9UW28_PHAAN|nr:hypothetical protein LR48_Vigan07g049600 [Vigna angularis]